MFKLTTFLSLVTFSTLIVSVLAENCGNRGPCPSNQYCGGGGSCHDRLPAGHPCFDSHEDMCLSGACVNHQCAQACERTSDCDARQYCHDAKYCRPTLQAGKTCSAGEQCASNKCADSKCASPHIVYKGVGEACDVAKGIACALGAVCEENMCRAIGSNAILEFLSSVDSLPLGLDKSNIVTNVNCSYHLEYDLGLFTCSEKYAYCDYVAEVCRPKQYRGGPCRYTNTDGNEIDAPRRCVSARCIHGHCGVEEAGQAFDPCVRDDECNVAGQICRTTSTQYGPVKMCNDPAESGLGKRCAKSSDCEAYGSSCYEGECRGIDEVQGKTCKTNDDCGDGIKRVKGEGAYTKYGFRCEQERCKWYNCFDGSTGLTGIAGAIFGDGNKQCPSYL